MATVSLCMIVKNEEKVLARCLDSIQDAVNEIIIVDTGSEDNTKNIALKYTDKVYDFEWVDDFSAARNFAFSKATMEFSMWLDADDVLSKEDKEKFLKLKENIPDSVDVVMMRYDTAFDEEGKPIFSYYRERLVRTNKGYKWKGRVHEAIEHGGKELYSDVAIKHKSIKSSYSNRNLKIYEKQIADGKMLSPRDTFYYGRELYYHKYYDKAITVLNGFIESQQGWIENNIEACKILSYCYIEKNMLYAAINSLTKSFCYDMPRAEICCDIGNVFVKMQDYKTAIFWYTLALTRKDDLKSGAFVSKDSSGYIPCIQLCVCYDRIGNIEKAAEYNQLAGQYRPYSKAYLANVEYFKRLLSHP